MPRKRVKKPLCRVACINVSLTYLENAQLASQMIDVHMGKKTKLTPENVLSEDWRRLDGVQLHKIPNAGAMDGVRSRDGG